MSLKGLLVSHQKRYLYLQTSSTSAALEETNIEYYIYFSKRALFIRKKVIAKSRQLSKHSFSKIFDNIDRTPTGL